MTNRTIITLLVTILVGIGCAIIGIGIAPYFSKNSKLGNTPLPPQGDIAALVSALNTANNGGNVEIILEEGTTPSKEKTEGSTVSIMHKVDAVRNVSWFGLGAGEVIAKDQGIKMGENDTAEIGQMKGYGVLEQLWVWLRGVLWTGIFIVAGGIVILLVLLLIPATAPVAAGILRIFASIIPGLGSVVERLVAAAKWEKPLGQVVEGNQDFKDKVKNALYLTEEQKQKILDDFLAAQTTKQDAGVQTQIKLLKATKGI